MRVLTRGLLPTQRVGTGEQASREQAVQAKEEPPHPLKFLPSGVFSALQCNGAVMTHNQ